MWFWRGAMMIFGTLVVPSVTGDVLPAKSLFELGEESFELGSYNEAVDYFWGALMGGHPNSQEAMMALRNSYAKLGREEMAFVRIAQAYVAGNEWGFARRFAEFALQLNPTEPLALEVVAKFDEEVSTQQIRLRNLKNSLTPEDDRLNLTSSNVFSHFQEAARRMGGLVGTDKVWQDPCPSPTGCHDYHHAYGIYLMPLRHQPIKFLEIGLGCNMKYGIGASINMWEAVLPNAQIYEAEFDEICVNSYAPKFYKEDHAREDRIHFLTGDQADPVTLRSWIVSSGGLFDFIIDDGGHSNKQQLNSLRVLFNEGLAPGGIYILEDIGDSRHPRYNDNNGEHTTDVISGLTQALVENPDWRVQASYAGYLTDLKSVHCFPELCVFIKCDGTEPRCGYR